MNEGGVTFQFRLTAPEGKAGHIDQSTLGLAIVERLDYIANALAVLIDKVGDDPQEIPPSQLHSVQEGKSHLDT